MEGICYEKICYELVCVVIGIKNFKEDIIKVMEVEKEIIEGKELNDLVYYILGYIRVFNMRVVLDIVLNRFVDNFYVLFFGKIEGMWVCVGYIIGDVNMFIY